MLKRFATVGGLTLVSRATGFLRDVVLAALLGAGPLADAFFVALRLPNHFRAIFGEGAFNAAFVPAYARLREQGGAEAAQRFANQMFVILLGSQLVLLAFALGFTPALVAVLAPGLADDPARFAAATEFTRVTFPYLLLVTLVTLYGGMLNVIGRFASAAGAPILLNLSMLATLSLAAFFPTAGHAAAWGVFIAGCLEALLVGADAARHGILPRFTRPRLGEEVKRFFKAFGPATVGSAGTQLAMFADTIIASFLAAGALSALYYADRIYQLPVGVIGIAAGTVLLPDMASRIGAGDEAGARRSQARAIELTLLLSVPCVVAFLLIPDLIMAALFERGAFTARDSGEAGRTLAAYAIGLLPVVLIRSLAATFLARGDTATPVKALFIAVAVNIALKVLLMDSYAQVGLAVATSAGAWVNAAMLVFFARRKGLIGLDAALGATIVRLVFAGAALTLAIWLLAGPVLDYFSSRPSLKAPLALATLVVLAGAVYVAAIVGLFGRQWLAIWRQTGTKHARPPGG